MSSSLEETTVAIPVLFTVELFPWADLAGSRFADAVAEFNDELRAFFADKVELSDFPTSNVTATDTVYGTGTELIPFVAATVVIGFKGIDVAQSKALAEEFKTSKFNHVTAEVRG
jgi:hypothetical protein